MKHVLVTNEVNWSMSFSTVYSPFTETLWGEITQLFLLMIDNEFWHNSSSFGHFLTGTSQLYDLKVTESK